MHDRESSADSDIDWHRISRLMWKSPALVSFCGSTMSLSFALELHNRRRAERLAGKLRRKTSGRYLRLSVAAPSTTRFPPIPFFEKITAILQALYG